MGRRIDQGGNRNSRSNTACLDRNRQCAGGVSMKYPVKRYFVSREGNHYREGDIFETDDLTRAKKLQGKNWIGAAIGGVKVEDEKIETAPIKIEAETAEKTRTTKKQRGV